MWNKTQASELLRIKYPIIQGPFGGKYSSVKLVSSVSNLGGLGSFGLNSYSPEEILKIDEDIKRSTDKAYMLNLWVPFKDDPTNSFEKKDFDALKKAFTPYFEQLKVPLPEMPNPKTQNFELQVESVLKARPHVASFIFGIPSKEIILELKKRGITSMATATTLDEAVMIEEAGIDLVIASGSEAGGHRASFMKSADESLTCTRLLIHQVVDNVSTPVIAAGGISNGKDIADVLKLGAGAAQIGTAFLATNESNASDLHKSKLLTSETIKTDLTKVYTGRLARVISTGFSKENNNIKITAPYPIQSAFLSPLRKAAIEQNKLDLVAFYSGQPSTTLKYKSVQELFVSLKEEASKYS
ncbi:NAD(P)H-dependent flavin oxidoreductase [Aquimarina macrocephali]|uniref:NAD(P)H-dependent flavin oxidoreductase n=1 Tax=Aquimarina macrocephali TaxID=666563 RepID=UPI0004643A10|nr:nitronate monooxygenase [Aquimarina macrocephali]